MPSFLPHHCSSIRAFFSFLSPSLPVVDTSCLLGKLQADELGKASSLAVFGTTRFVLLFFINQLLASVLLTEVGFTDIIVSSSGSDRTRNVSVFQGLGSLLTYFLFLSYQNSTQSVPGTLWFPAVHPWKRPTFPSLTHRWCELPARQQCHPSFGPKVISLNFRSS